MVPFAKGFRPFFLLGAALATAMVVLWLAVLRGIAAPAGPLTGLVWHGHEMVYGFTVAIVAGFLLTAVGNWTGRETATGAPLAGLALLWVAGRIALWALPGWAASVVDLAFLPALAVAIGRPLLAARQLRNAPFPVVLGLLWACDLLVHLDAHGVGPALAVAANRAAVHWIVLVAVLVTARVVPMFTRNATGAEGIGNDRVLDRVAVGAVATVAVLQLIPAPRLEAVAAAVGAVAVLGRARRWGLGQSWRQPLLWVLHLGHGWIGVGLGLEALAAAGVLPRSPALHALTVGAIGMLTVGMMARVALGHGGRPLVAPSGMALAFGAVGLAAAVRVIGPMVAPSWTIASWWTSGLLWTGAFLLFLVRYAPILVLPRADGRPG